MEEGSYNSNSSTEQTSSMAESLKEKTILNSKALIEYILNTSAYPNEQDQLKELREATIQKYQHMSIMNVNVDEAQVIAMFLKVMNAKKTIEVGVFTGYSLLTTALALPDDGQILAVDIDKEAYEVGLPYITKANVHHKIKFVHGNAMIFLNGLLTNEKHEEFDFAFVDADKDNYINYHELLLPLIKVGGIIAYDNTLWYGSVALPDNGDRTMDEETMRFLNNHGRKSLMKFNQFIANDPRIESSLLSIGDGLTLCRRLY